MRRVKRLEAEGVIEGYCAKINRAKVGMGVTAFVEVGLERHREEEAERFRRVALRLPQVVSCHVISGESDFLLEIAAEDLNQISEFVLKRLRQIPGVKNLHTSFVLVTMKNAFSLRLEAGHSKVGNVKKPRKRSARNMGQLRADRVQPGGIMG